MSDDILHRFQSSVYGALRAVPALALARKIQDDKGDLESTLETELATVNDDSGKCGLGIIVLALEVEAAETNLPGPPLMVRVDVQCIEHVELNRSELEGTLIRSTAAATRVLAALSHLRLDGVLLYPAKRPIRPLPMREGFSAHLVSLRADLLSSASEKTQPVWAEWDESLDVLELTCSSPDAAIYYTTNETFPAAWNADATLYTSPVLGLLPGTRIRCAAYAPDLNPSDVELLTVSE